MIWKRDNYGGGSICIVDDGLTLKVNKSFTKASEYHGYIFGKKSCTASTSKECQEICEIGAKNIIERAYSNHVKGRGQE